MSDHTTDWHGNSEDPYPEAARQRSLRWAEHDAFWRDHKVVRKTTLFGKHYLWVKPRRGGNLRLVPDAG